MRFEGLDLNLLVALSALLEEQSVTAAAQRLHITQPAMSASLNRLREYFQDELFIVIERKLVPTALSASLELPVRDILSRIRTNLIARPNFDPARSDRLFTFVISDYSCLVLLNTLQRSVYALAPGIRFEFIPFDDRPDEKLKRGEIDFLVFPDKYLTSDHPKKMLFADEFCCLVWSGNKQIGKTLPLDHYLSSGHVSAAFGKSRHISFEERVLQERGLNRRIEVVAPNFSMMATMVVGTNRIATIHKRLARLFTSHLPLRQLPSPVPIDGFRESLQWPQSLDGDASVRWLRGMITDAAAHLDTPSRHKRRAS